jgi:ATP-dependent Clp protease adaptor protein ClpS
MPRDVHVAEPETTTTVDTGFAVMSDEELEKPYRVILQNDDVTPMEIVVWVLEAIFELPSNSAYDVMMVAHVEGRALVTVLPFEEANNRVFSAQSFARNFGFPLVLYLEPDE